MSTTADRDQLTAVGGAAPNLHVGSKIANHQPSIAGGAPGVKVSWRATALRHDAYRKKHPLVVRLRNPRRSAVIVSIRMLMGHMY